MAERDFSEIAKLSERYNKDPKSRIFVQLADAYRKSNMIDEALEILQKGLQHHPSYALAHLILGKCHYDKRLYEQAKDAFEQTLAYDPQNIVALRMLAQTCEATKDEDGQLKAYKGIIAIDPFDAPAQEKLTKLEALQQKKKPLHTVAMAEEYEKQGDIKKAIEIYEHLHFTDPTDIVLSQKVTELRKQLSDTSTEKKEEEKIETLQVETFFTPDQLGPEQPPETPSPAAPAPTTPEPEDTSVPDTPKPSEEPAHEDLNILQPFDSAPQPPEENLDILEPTEAAKQTDDQSPPTLKEEKTEETILPLEDFLSDKPTPEPSTPSDVPTTTPSPPDSAAAPTPSEADKVAEEDAIPTLKIDDETTPAPAPEQPTLHEPVKTQPVETSPPVSEKKSEAEEKLDLLQPVDEPPPQEPTVEPTAKEEKPPATESIVTTEDVPAKEVPTVGEPSVSEEKPTESPPAPQPAPHVEKPEEKKEQKPKEEDFQSFQDWLSGLLK